MRPLQKEDLEACCALVVQYLQTESSRGAFLEKTDHMHKKDVKNDRTISPLLRNHLLGHVSFLKERGILKGGVPAGFASALILNDEMKTQQDPTQTSRNENVLASISTSESQSSSLSTGEGPVKPTHNKNHKLKPQDDRSSCEDESRHGKFLEKKRVAGNSNVLPENTKETDHEEKEDDEDLSDISDIEIPGLMPANIHFTRKPTSKQISEASISSSESSPQHR
ncbi:PREDICTED: centrosomal protein kizuna-like [Nanorana parkeri]|uniref:centrosomal protein kizuna-like n=1 Tax=Nanorana parkeri TaxID=125878 RepID=UPI000853FAA1|nr:PREDICTED: centrosomal protein kizuna-like [Nanorana parkeri]